MRRFLAVFTAFALVGSFTTESTTLASSNVWRPVGDPISSDSGSNLNGFRVDMDDAGDTVAVVSFDITGLEPTQSIGVYDWNRSTRRWELRGEPITRTFDYDLALSIDLIELLFLGSGIDLSGDGDSIAVASPIDGIGGDPVPVGAVDVYDWAGGAWTARERITAPESGALFGWSIALSDDGRTIVVGSLETDCGSFVGNVRVFDWNDPTWSERAGFVPCDPESPLVGIIGSSVAVSDDGDTVAMSGIFLEGFVDATGAVFARHWTPGIGGAPGEWSEVSGFPVNVDEVSLPSGMEMNDDGTSIAVSSLVLSGDTAISVGVFDDHDDGWSQRGDLVGNTVPIAPLMSKAAAAIGSRSLSTEARSFETLIGPTTLIPPEIIVVVFYFFLIAQVFGSAIDINGDGSTVAVNEYDASGDLNTGSVSVYDWLATTWMRRGSTINPNGAGEDLFVPLSVAISADGNRIVSGQVQTLEISGNGRGRVYEWAPGPSSLPTRISVTFDPVGGTCSDKTAPWTITKRGAITLPTAEQCTRPGYVLLGWTTNPAKTTPEELLHTVVGRPTHLTAVWGAVPPAPTNLTALTNFGCEDCVLLGWQQPPGGVVVTRFEVAIDGALNGCVPQAWGDWWVCSISGVSHNTPHTFTVRGVGEFGAGVSATLSTT